ncbi:MAG: TMEM165/GDT1 family protein [Coleofasciculaceae cyanobacterium]
MPFSGIILTALPRLIKPVSKNSPQSSEFAVKSELEKEKQNQTKASKAAQELNWQWWTIFSSTFFTIFLAEMGDKTQLATLLMSAESQSPWIVFAGAAIALITTSLLGVLIGHWLASRLSPRTLETIAGILLLFISVGLLWDVVNIGG